MRYLLPAAVFVVLLLMGARLLLEFEEPPRLEATDPGAADGPPEP